MKITYLQSLPETRSGTVIKIRELQVGEICYPREYDSVEQSDIAWEGMDNGIYCIKHSRLKVPYLSETWNRAHDSRIYTHTRTVIIE